MKLSALVSFFSAILFFNLQSPVGGALPEAVIPDAVAAPAEADLAVTTTPSSETVGIGQTLVYTITINNLGPASATDVELHDQLPDTFVLASASSSQGTISAAGQVVTAEVGNLDPGASAIITLTGITASLATLQNVATVLGTEPDPNPANDVQVTLTVVSQPPEFLTQPISKVIPCGHYPRFSATATGSEPLSFQWLANGEAIPGATDNTFDLGAVYPSDDGRRYSVVVSNAFGVVESTNAILNVVDAEAPTLVGSSRVDLQACKLEYSIVSPK